MFTVGKLCLSKSVFKHRLQSESEPACYESVAIWHQCTGCLSVVSKALMLLQVTKHHKKRFSTSLVTREIRMNSTARYHLTLLIMVITKNFTRVMLGKVWGKRNPPTLLVGMQTEQPLWRTGWSFLRKLKSTTWPSKSTPEHASRENPNLKGCRHPSAQPGNTLNDH